MTPQVNIQTVLVGCPGKWVKYFTLAWFLVYFFFFFLTQKFAPVPRLNRRTGFTLFDLHDVW